MLAELDRHPHARVVLAPALGSPPRPSHAYLFHGPGGSGKRAAARALAAELLSEGAADPDGARRRALSGAHPDLTWVVPGGAHEILVADIDQPVVAAATRTPFEARRRVFVIERADQLGEEAANRMLKTLEEPAPFAHLILLSDRPGEVLATIRSRCQAVRFEAPAEADAADALRGEAVSAERALACVRLALGDGERARELACAQGGALRDAAERMARGALSGQMLRAKPWSEVLAAARRAGEQAEARVTEAGQRELELTASRDRRRVQTEWSERARRARRRAQTAALDLALQIASLWYRDLAALAHGAGELVCNVDRRSELERDAGVAPARLIAAVELVEETRERFALNVSEELALEALGVRLAATLGEG
ncbi:MAG TPA: hypothetical protein VKV27_13960 [Solirubrobacteraceae bacterium]|nr:hypothetical protein [Solirubrobacteraceae bacterium]